jgi:glucose/arabinose dehydrogenase
LERDECGRLEEIVRQIAVQRVRRTLVWSVSLALLAIVGMSAMAWWQLGFAQDGTIETKSGPVKVETVAKKLNFPWGLAFLPDGRMLVTERPGRLRIVAQDGTLSEPIKGVPEVFAQGQGGLLGLALDPKFSANNLIYFAFSEPGEGGAGTAVARAKLRDTSLDDVEIIFRQKPKVRGGLHFGGRLAFASDGTLFVTLGERFQFDPAQDLSTHLGKIVRINPDGSVPDDNPFVGQDGKLPEIWSYGHRNAQGAAIHPETGRLWENEFGPEGGDELNIPEAGKNYGWPVVSWGEHYDGKKIPKPPAHPEFADAIKYWNPVISPSGMTFYTADTFPEWKGNLLIASLSSKAIVRLTLKGDKVTGEERLAMGRRIRDVVQGPDGAVYALVDDHRGKILRLTPASPRS